MPKEFVSQHFFSSLSRKVNFFILRHGESVANADKRIQGPSDYPLNDAGRQQAKNLASYLADKNITSIFHSPLVRAAETASIVHKAIASARCESSSLLAELNTGIFTNLKISEIKAKHPELYEKFRYQSWEAVPEAETEAALYDRVTAIWSKLKVEAEASSTGNIAAVTHGGTIQWLFRITFGHTTWMPLITTDNCSIFELEVEPIAKGLPVFMQWKHINFVPDINFERNAPVF